MPEVDRVLGNAEKMSGLRSGGSHADFGVAATEKIVVNDIMACARPRRIWSTSFARPHPRLRAGAERLRPPLHVLHHSLRARQFALGADGRGGGAGAPARRAAAIARSCSPASTSPATARSARRAEARRAGEGRSCAHVPELERLRLSSIDSVEADDDLLDAFANDAAADAASASVAAGRRRPDPQAHEAPPPARRRHRVLPTGAAAAARHGVRRRHHRRLSDRDRGDVRPLARSGRRMRPDASARLSVLAAPRHAGRADAAGRRRRSSRSAPGACASAAMRRSRRHLDGEVGARAAC